jgi:hypothetical protein
VEQPTKFEFIVNLKTAKEMGLTIPPTVLFQADKIIKFNLVFSLHAYLFGLSSPW